MDNTHQRQAKTKLIAGIITIMVIAGIVLIADHLKHANTTAAAASVPSGASGATSTAADSAGTNTVTDPQSAQGSSGSSSTGIKDGTYTASADYYVPHGDESISVTLMVKDGVVSNAQIQNSEGDRDSANFQERFASAYTQYVVGQKLSSLNLSVISGASDTTDGFNDAVSKIRAQVQA
jgi:uncharacterized protein with FMN-binding domain